MDYFFSDISGEHNTFVEVIPNAVSQKSLNLIEKYVKTQSFFDASTIKSENLSNKNDMDIRSTLMCWMSDGEKVPDNLLPVYKELTSLSRRVNDAFWRYNIEGWEPFQYGEYRADKNGHYTWHIDTSARFNGGHVRKLSFSLGLSHRHEYEGGNLEIKYGCKPFEYKIGKGEMVVFPSFLLHRVTPVTKGVRKTLVGWGRGPNFV
jgi:PKHD-type hydroxylase